MMRLTLRYSVHHAFHDDDRTVHNQPEVDGAQTHQVARHAEQIHHRDGKQHGQRYHGGYDKPCPHIAKHQY